jgi:hypothetical protein
VDEDVEPRRAPTSPFGVPRPAAVSAAQVEAVLGEVRTRREQVQALAAQLTAFDAQLAAFEESLRPMLEWSSAWADVERSMLGPWGRPPADGS